MLDRWLPKGTLSYLGIRRSVEEFAAHWEAIRRFYASVQGTQSDSDPLNDPSLLEMSSVPKNLAAMVELLEAEDAASNSIGPCLEFLLQNKVLDNLCGLGQVDRPPGMEALVTKTIVELVRKLRQPLLPHVTVHRSIQDLLRKHIRLPSGRKSPAHGEMLELLGILVTKAQQDPSVLAFFVDQSSQDDPQFLLFGVLVRYLKETGSWGEKSRGAILALLNSGEPRLTQYVIRRTPFAQILIEWLTEAFAALPTATEVQTGLDVEATQIFHDRLRYCNAAVKNSSQELGAHICESLVRSLLKPVVQPALIQTCESAAKATTDYVRSMISICSAPAIVNTLCAFLLEESGPVRPILIQRIDSLAEDLSAATLKLFDSLLGLHDKFVFDTLILKDLRPFSVPLLACEPQIFSPTPSPPTSTTNTTTTTVNSSERVQNVNPTVGTTSAAAEGAIRRQGSRMKKYAMDFPDLASQELERHLPALAQQADMFLSSFPPVLDATHGPYDAYLSDAQASTSLSCQAFLTWPPEPPTAPPSDAAGHLPESLPDSSFLQVLLKVLEGALSNSLATNLLVTGIFAKLAQCPHPLLHAYLLCPSAALPPSVRTLPRTLRQVFEDVSRRRDLIVDFETRVDIMRKSLHIDAAPTPRSADAGLSAFDDVEERDMVRFISGVIVLDEFIKELAAVLYCKCAIRISSAHLQS